MQKPVFFAILGLSLAVTAVSLGFAASRYLSLRYYAPPPALGGATASTAGNASAALPPEQWTNLFAPEAGMKLPSKHEPVPAGSGATASTTRYTLLGTISSPVPSMRRAILWAEGMADPLLAREQQEIEPGVRVASIERERVKLRQEGALNTLELLPVGSRLRGAAPTPAPTAARGRVLRPAPQPGVSIQVNRIGENAFSMDEGTVAQLTGNINQFMTQARIIPYFEGNQSAGYRLAAIRPGSAFEQLGFRAGDIIQRVNTVELNSPEKMYTIFQNLKDEKRVTVDVLRQGQKTTLTYEIR
ncbi:MAG: hypothetical protein Kow00128_19290 [Deltaproteobacteria bacterium]